MKFICQVRTSLLYATAVGVLLSRPCSLTLALCITGLPLFAAHTVWFMHAFVA